MHPTPLRPYLISEVGAHDCPNIPTHTHATYCCTWTTSWLGGLAVRALESRLDGRAFGSRPPRLLLGWVTVFGRVNHLGISSSHLGQLSLLPYAGREMSTDQSAVMLCGWGNKGRMSHSTCG